MTALGPARLLSRWLGSLRLNKRSEKRISSDGSAKRGAPKSVLLAWELGRGMGHIYRLLPIARDLAARGYRVVFALRNQVDAKVIPTVLPDAEILQAPYFIRNPSAGLERRRNAYNYADMLLSCGYDSHQSLEPLVASWHALFDLVKPSLIVCDHSPTVVLAAAGLIPVIQVGSGFASPPAGQPFLGLCPAAAEGAAEREVRVLESIGSIRASHRMQKPQQVSDMFGWAESFACSLPELDPYSAVRTPPALGTLHGLPPPKPPAQRNFVFGYLAADDARVPRVLESLVRAKVRCSLYIRQASPAWQETLEGTTVKLFDAPRQLNEIIGAASAVLHHGGATTTEIALAIGRPQFLLPRYVEQGLTAEAIEKMGCGVNLTMRKEDVGECIRRALSRGHYAKTSAAQAARLAERPNADVKAMIVAACLKHLA